ncbi:hypothetical protein [Micromonospora sonchi]|uniref:hypothetical protein n=1 Tax=Micromonospora sonchi TaxID=1763543 RepID=UPI001667683C|nr:hypothetical protein [Micromonospora sonchi]
MKPRLPSVGKSISSVFPPPLKIDWQVTVLGKVSHSSLPTNRVRSRRLATFHEPTRKSKSFIATIIADYP